MAAPVFAWDPTITPGSLQAQPRRCDWPVNLLRLDGPDVLRFLHGQTSQALEQAQSGQWLSTCCITPTARLRALAEVLVDGEGATLVIRVGDGEAVRSALDRVLFPADAVRMGPLAAGLLVESIGVESDPQAPVAGRWAALAAPDKGWRLGSQLTLLPADQPLPAALAELSPLSPQEQEHWRLGQGLPVAPNEVNDDTNPFELGLADWVSLNKGCYLGQETLAKLATYDGVKRQLRRWICIEPPAQGTGLAAGTKLWADAGEIADEPAGNGEAAPESTQRAGVITSSFSPDGGRVWIGLALVRRQALEAGRLRAGEGAGAPLLELSLPERFVAPPVGSGSAASRP
jgi:folate-binding protein YgfZ